MKVDKAVCTNETMEDLYRAIRYETVFTALVENKILAIKRECDERQRSKKTRARFKFGGLLSSKKKICCVKHESLTDLVLQQLNSKNANAIEGGVVTAVRDDATENSREETLMQQRNVSQNELFKPIADDSITQVNYVDDTPHDDKIQIHESESISIGSDKSKKITFQSGLIDDKHKIYKNPNLRRKLSVESSFSQNSSSIIESYISDDSQIRKSRGPDVLSSNQNKLNLHENAALLDHERHRLRILEARSISAQCSPVFPRPLFRNHNHNIATQAPCLSDDNQLVPLKLIRSQNDIDASIDSVNLVALASNNIGIDANKDREQFTPSSSNANEIIRLDKTTYGGQQFDTKQGFIKSFNQLTSQNQNTKPVITTINSKKDALKLHRLMNPSIDLMTESKSASKSRKNENNKFGKSSTNGKVGDTSVENIHRPKIKHKRSHKCSDPLLIYPSSNGFQHCILSMPPNQPLQLQYDENVVFDVSLQMDGSRNRDLEVIMPSHRKHKHRHHHHHHHHNHNQHGRKVGKRKILVHDLDAQSVKVIDPDDLPQRARWTIIATACLLLIMCLLLVGVTLRMAPFIDDMVRQENERLMQESLNRAKFARNFTETAPLAASEEIP